MLTEDGCSVVKQACPSGQDHPRPFNPGSIREAGANATIEASVNYCKLASKARMLL
jgi:hypothetical protein